MNRFKNYALWVAVAALFGMLLQDTGLFQLTPKKYDNYVEAILGVLVLAGIINNPSIGTGFKDGE